MACVCAGQEATPTDHAFIVQKRALQRAWLQDLDQQRQDDKLRHKQEKQLLNQVTQTRPEP